MKLYIRTRLIESFPSTFRFLVLRQRKVALHTISHLTPIEVWRNAVSTASEGRRVSSEARLRNCTQVWGWAKFGQRATHSWGKIALHTCSDLSKPVRTCMNLSRIHWPCTLVVKCHFLHFWMFLFFSLASYPGEIAYLNSPNRQLSNGVRVMALHWSKIINPSRSSCLKNVQRKSFEGRNFLSYFLSCWKLHISTQLIQSFPLTYGMWSCGLEEIVDPSRGES